MDSRRISVLVANGEPRHTIDIVRSLGRHRINVSIISKRPWPPARFSRYLTSSIIHDCKNSSLEDEIEFLEDLVREHHYDVVISSGTDGFRVLSFGRERIGELARVAVASYDMFSIAEDKAETTRFAQSIGVPVPETHYPLNSSDLVNYFGIKFPVVIKARRGQGHYGFADRPDQLPRLYSQICSQVPDQIKSGLWPIIQAYIPGKAHGLYALMNHGELRGWFMHERIHEVPPSGGPSSMARSFYDEELLRCGNTLLGALNWHGVAMVEFKKDARDGRYKLIEVNPKFWGSLGLSIASGVDFPYLLVKMALEGDIEVTGPSRETVTYQWLSMDMAYSWAVRKPWLWLCPVLKGVPNDFRPLDPLPNLALIAQGAADTLLGQRALATSGERKTPGSSEIGS